MFFESCVGCSRTMKTMRCDDIVYMVLRYGDMQSEIVMPFAGESVKEVSKRS